MSAHSSPEDTRSPMYPDRLIRPLPKRRLRQRLSEDEAKAIEFPPNPPQVAPLFSVPYVSGVDKGGFSGVPVGANVSARAGFGPNVQSVRGGEEDHRCDCGEDHGIGDDYDGEGDDANVGAQQDGRPGWDHVGGKPQGPGSTTSSADGYESFENTNNKKKRKIPLSGEGHHSSLSAEMVNMSISANEGALDDTGPIAGHYTPSGVPLSGTGISGAGRGRFGRPKHSMERRPLGASTNGLNAFAKSHSMGAKGKREWVGEGNRLDFSLALHVLTLKLQIKESFPQPLRTLTSKLKLCLHLEKATRTSRVSCSKPPRV